jgi:hypothetical protein
MVRTEAIQGGEFLDKKPEVFTAMKFQVAVFRVKMEVAHHYPVLQSRRQRVGKFLTS